MKMTKLTSAKLFPLSAGYDGLRLNSRILGWEPLMLTGNRARMVTKKMQMQMRKQKHRQSMMDQRRM
jgi:hypothetical protein